MYLKDREKLESLRAFFAHIIFIYLYNEEKYCTFSYLCINIGWQAD
jgi:hypothetical protein